MGQKHRLPWRQFRWKCGRRQSKVQHQIWNVRTECRSRPVNVELGTWRIHVSSSVAQQDDSSQARTRHHSLPLILPVAQWRRLRVSHETWGRNDEEMGFDFQVSWEFYFFIFTLTYSYHPSTAAMIYTRKRRKLRTLKHCGLITNRWLTNIFQESWNGEGENFVLCVPRYLYPL